MKRQRVTIGWLLMCAAVLRALKAETPTAASLNVARAFLRDNDCNIATLREWMKNPLGNLTLPQFADDDEAGGQANEADPLKSIASFSADEDD
jgi:hypothetical protein